MAANVVARRNSLPTRYTTGVCNFEYRWKLSENIKFLKLLKQYPILYEIYVPSKSVLDSRQMAMASLLKDCSKAKLTLRDKKALIAKIAIIKKSFSKAFEIFKKTAKRTPNSKPLSTLPWFYEAEFLDLSGYMTRMKQRWTKAPQTITSTTTASASRAQPPVRAVTLQPRRTLPRRAPISQPCPTPRRISLPIIVSAQRQIQSEDVEVKLEVEEEDDSVEDGEIKVNNDADVEEDEDDEEYEHGELIPDAPQTQQQPQRRSNNQIQRGDQTYLQQTPHQTMPVPPPVPVPIPVQHPPQYQTDYFHAFLEYTKLRTQDYNGRQKREIMNTVSIAMNRIDEEAEVLDSQNYSFQMYSSMNEYNSRTPKE